MPMTGVHVRHSRRSPAMTTLFTKINTSGKTTTAYRVDQDITRILQRLRGPYIYGEQVGESIEWP